MIRLLARTVALALLISLLIATIEIIAKRAGFAISEGFFMGLVVGSAGGLGGYVAKSLRDLKNARPVKPD
jgi:hypothetical protein